MFASAKDSLVEKQALMARPVTPCERITGRQLIYRTLTSDALFPQTLKFLVYRDGHF